MTAFEPQRIEAGQAAGPGRICLAGSLVATSVSVILVGGAVSQLFSARWMPTVPTPQELDAAVSQYHRAAAVACGVPIAGVLLGAFLRRWIAVTVQVILLVLALTAVVVFHISPTTHTDPPRTGPSPSTPSQPCYSGSGHCN